MSTRAKSVNQRKSEQRKRLRAAGLVPVEIWCRRKHKQAVKDFAASLRD